MPAFYPRPMLGQTPLTPPDSGSGYGYSAMLYPQDPYASHQNIRHARHDASYGYHQSYLPPQTAAAPSAYAYPQSGYHNANSLPPIQNYYEPLGATTLPPLRIPDGAPFANDYQRQLQHQQHSEAAQEQQRRASKNEKATGGVSAKLDYDIERMTDFVTEATQSIFQQSMQSPPAFRKWVLQVLSATRLPSATILLSLHYLNDRLMRFPESVTLDENQIYRLLAGSLILGSKFLDDNTFINKSWSEVTSIKVSELNLLEMQWLHLIQYQLHVDPKADNGVQAWLDAWQQYDAKYTFTHQPHPARLSPLHTDVSRTSSHRRDRYSPYPSPYTASTRSFDTPHSTRSSHFTPYAAPGDMWAQSGGHHSSFDDYYGSNKRSHQYHADTDELSCRSSGEHPTRHGFTSAPPASNPPFYSSSSAAYSSNAATPAWDQHPWSSAAHRYDCGCAACAYQHHYRLYPLASSYTSQTVVG